MVDLTVDMEKGVKLPCCIWQVYNQFDVVSKPTDEAIKLDEMSWYRHMEDSLIAFGAQAVKTGGSWANATELEQIKADVSQHLVSTQVSTVRVVSAIFRTARGLFLFRQLDLARREILEGAP